MSPQLRSLGVAMALTVPLVAQSPANLRRLSVRGVVYDSIAHAPLAGALVQLTSRDQVGPVHSAVSDSAGRFVLADLPTGHFVIGFYHDALTALGLDAPVRAVDLSGDGDVTADIGVPSGAMVRALRCGGDAAAIDRGMLAGFVRDAAGDSALVGATVVVEWRAIALDPGRWRTVTEHATTTVGGDGTYRLCALPAEAPLALRVTAAGHRGITGPITVPAKGVVRRDLRLADSSLARGSARLTGRIVHEDGKPAEGAHAVIAALGLDVPATGGRFVFADLPAGTWSVDARWIGLEPQTVLLDAVDSGSVVTITMSDRAQALDVVTVIGSRSRESRLLDDILYRKRLGASTVFLPGSPFLAEADRVSDVLRAANGFRPKGDGGYFGRLMATGMVARPCDNIRVYVDGMRLPDGLKAMDTFVLVRDVLAVEAYPDIVMAPVEWRFGGDDGACAIVAVWSKGTH